MADVLLELGVEPMALWLYVPLFTLPQTIYRPIREGYAIGWIDWTTWTQTRRGEGQRKWRRTGTRTSTSTRRKWTVLNATRTRKWMWTGVRKWTSIEVRRKLGVLFD